MTKWENTTVCIYNLPPFPNLSIVVDTSLRNMKSFFTVSLCFLLLCESLLSSPVTDSLVVSSTEPTNKEKDETKNSDNIGVNPQIYSMQIHANVSNRFARTLITSKVRNLKMKAEETTFSVILPENAFISEFEMEIKDKVYKAYVKEKEEAKQIYQQAVSRGQSAAHVELSARDSKTFTVSVNIEPESKTIFRLVYEELLQRELGQYELVINIHPGQTVEDLGVQVHINESRPLTFVKTPSLRTGNEVSKNDEKLDPSAKIDIIDGKSAVIKFSPDINQQKDFGGNLGGNKENGLAGQFVVQYDVERDPQGGEVLIRDGYFVHFFAPSELKPLSKHVVFVLDHSGSMGGRKIEQLIEAMQNILSDLKSEDLFSIVRFADWMSVWNADSNKFVSVNIRSQEYGNLEPHLREANLAEAVKATPENIAKAKKIIEDKSDMGLTNIIGGLEIGLFLAKRTQEKSSDKYQPMIVFLTDGSPNVGMHSGDEITTSVTKLNSGTNRVPIFSLSFGQGADKNFLRKLSSQNLGFSRHIYEAADASLQLQDFYRTISAPLLSNITFQYVDNVTHVTKTHYPILFKGSELVVAGRTEDNLNTLPHVGGTGVIGSIFFNTTRSEPVSSLERLWAYLSVKQILTERELETNKTELTKKALDLALKYSFVTAISSLVVVKPNETAPVETSNNIAKPGTRYATSGVSGPVLGRSALHSSHSVGYSGSVRTFGKSVFNRRGPSWSPSHSTRPVLTSSYTTRRTPLMPKNVTTKPEQDSTLPQWIADLQNSGGNITTPTGTFKLGQKGDVKIHTSCPKTPLNGTGTCTIIFDCPQVFLLLTDINVYLQYFCPLNEFAGVCCPGTSGNSSNP